MILLRTPLRLLHKGFNASKIPNINPEAFHSFAMKVSNVLETYPHILEKISEATYVDGEKDLKVNLGDLELKNSVGLAAGFVKEAHGLKFWESFGFGYMTIGGVTQHAQSGNKKQRIFRFKDGVVNGMGLPGNGINSTIKNLAERKEKGMMPEVPLFANLCNSAITKPEQKIDEFKHLMSLLFTYVEAFEINISCPNQAGVCSLTSDLENILKELTEYNKALATQYNLPPRKILVKISPLTGNEDNPSEIEDGTIEGLKSIARVCNNYEADGVIATNTAKEHAYRKKTKIRTPSGDIITGGASGKQIQEVSLKTVRALRGFLDQNIPIIGVGGIGYDEKLQRGQSAINMMNAGADSLQLYSSFVQDGTVMVVSDIKKALLENLKNTRKI